MSDGAECRRPRTGAGLGAVAGAFGFAACHAPCCVLGPLTALFGLGGTAFAAWADRLKGPILALSLCLLAYSFRRAYGPSGRRWEKAISWGALVLSVTGLCIGLLGD